MKNSRANPKTCGIERRAARMLKEFLRDEEINSNSSSGFKSFPRSLPSHSEPPPATLPRSRSRSRAAAEAAVSSFQKLLHSAVKSLHSFTKKKPDNCEGKVKVKDILRWKSFRDVADEIKSQPLASAVSAAATTTTSNGSAGGTGCSEGSRSRSSWADTDGQFGFTADELPCWWVNDNGKNGKSVKEDRIIMWKEDHNVDGGDPDSVRGITDTTDSAPPLMDPVPQDQSTNEEDKEQSSPVSVLNSPFRDEISDDELVSAFDQSCANVERTKQRLLQSLQWFESLAGVDDDQSSVEEDDIETELVEEREKSKSRVYLIKGQCKLKRAGQSLKDKEACIKVVEGQGQWRKFGEETEEIGVDLEVALFHDLLDEALLDLFG